MAIPLWLVFGLQSLIVTLSFIAVILVLVLQQQDQYRQSVFDKVGLMQDNADKAMTAPIITRERINAQVATRLTLDTSLWYRYNDSIHDAHIQRFLNLTYFMIYKDPISYAVFQYRLDPYHLTPGRVGVTSLIYAAAGITADLIAVVSTFNNTVIFAPNPTYPLQFGITAKAPLEFRGGLINTFSTPKWGGSTVLDDTVNNRVRFVALLAYPLEFNTTANASSLSLAYSIDVHYLIDLTASALLTPNTQALLVDRQTDGILAGINTGASLYYNATIAWYLDTYPNRDVVAKFREADASCRFESNCNKSAVDSGGNIISLLHMTTTYNFRMDLLQVTPRDYFFAAGRRAVVTGVVIGVAAAVLVLVSCIVIWFAIQRPIRRLRESMELAAVMRNDEVSDTSSVLSELDLLSQSFQQMNGKLLQARAFMPQALLFMTDESAEAPNEVESDDEGAAPDKLENSTHEEAATPRLVFSDRDVMSERGTTRSGTYKSEGTRNSGGIKNIGSCTLALKKVGVLIVNARGTHRLLTLGASKLEKEQVRLVELVERCSKAEKGVVDAFQGDHFVITFNAARAVVMPGRNAALAALSIDESFPSSAAEAPRFSMGLAVGRAYVGNTGSATLKKNCTIGAVYVSAIGLERLSKRIERSCVVNSRALSDLEHYVHVVLVGSVQLSKDERDVAAALEERVHDATPNQEWLYQVQSGLSVFSELNNLVELYCKQGPGKAVQDGIDRLQTQPRDKAFQRGVDHLKKLVDRRLRLEALSTQLEALELHVEFDVDFDVR